MPVREVIHSSEVSTIFLEVLIRQDAVGRAGADAR